MLTPRAPLGVRQTPPTLLPFGGRIDNPASGHSFIAIFWSANNRDWNDCCLASFSQGKWEN
jgi:hypothetical protein